MNLYPSVKLGEASIKLPILGGIGYHNLLAREIWLDHILETLFSLKEGAFIDVGINIGQTLLKIIELGYDRQYIGFEPNPQCCQYIEKLEKINKFPKVKIVPVALGEKNFLTDLYLVTEYDLCACVVEGFRDKNFYCIKKLVPVFKGDELFAKLIIESVSILKIDVEGGELEVLSGLKNVISKMRPFIVCEVLPVYDEDTEIGKMRRKRTNKVIEMVTASGYGIFRLLHDGTVVALEWIDTHCDLTLCEYLFAPIEYIKDVQMNFKVSNHHSE